METQTRPVDRRSQRQIDLYRESEKRCKEISMIEEMILMHCDIYHKNQLIGLPNETHSKEIANLTTEMRFKTREYLDWQAKYL